MGLKFCEYVRGELGSEQFRVQRVFYTLRSADIDAVSICWYSSSKRVSVPARICATLEDELEVIVVVLSRQVFQRLNDR